MDDDLKIAAQERLKAERQKLIDQVNIDDMSREKMIRIVEDLMIHQIELELQNENLTTLHLELEKSRDKFLTLYENAPNGFISFNANGIVQEMNKATLELIGKRRLDVLLKPFTLFIDQKSHDIFFNALRKAKETGSKIKIEMLTKNDRTIIFEVLYLKASTEDTQYLAALTDVSLLKETERKLEKAKKEADNANQAKSLFLANMSHEIRNPLNQIIGALELLECEEKNEEQLSFFKMVKTSSDMLLDLLENLLDISKIEAGKLVLNKTSFDLSLLIDKVCDSYMINCRKKNIEIVVNNSLGQTYCVNSDKQRIRQIVNNLISNAVKFTNTGTVKVILEQLDDGVGISVADSGIGIKEEELSKLFDTFYRSEKNISESQSGTGLGLSITKKLVDLLKGNITISSEYGKGSTFQIQLPLEKIDCYNEGGESKMNQKSLSDLFVLIADDNPINQTIFGKMIRNLGCHVEVAGDGRSVLKLLKEEGKFYDLIFLDIQMPDMDGLELTKHIRDFQKNTSKKSKIIAVSGHATKYHIDKARDSGMDDYLTKPVKSSKIMEVCQKHMAATTKDTD